MTFEHWLNQYTHEPQYIEPGPRVAREPDEHVDAVLEELVGEIITSWEEFGIEEDDTKTFNDWLRKFHRYLEEVRFHGPGAVKKLATVAVACMIWDERKRAGITRDPPPQARWSWRDFEDPRS